MPRRKTRTEPPASAATSGGPVKLTQFSHGGGCGCKIAPAMLQQILTSTPAALVPRQLLVGTETSDDAAVYQLNGDQALVATTDFFMPIVDDAFDFGAIAATNALSDVYAMGGVPLLALAVVGMPIDKLPLETIRRILEGGESVCRRAGIPIAGGHSIDSLEPIYGLVAIGVVHPDHLKRNSGARPGDKLVLGKGLGVGFLSAALKKGMLSTHAYEVLVSSTTQLNTPGRALACLAGVHAMTDVTGFGLLGHLVEICKASRVSAVIDYAALPILPGALDYGAKGCVTGASARNWTSYGESVSLPNKHFGELDRALLTDPQTSGGLLISCAPEVVTEVLATFLQDGFDHATVIGEVGEGKPEVTVVRSH
ncbi:selenide, water dikinase SelD [Accumulibacter sp.]|uniref:selenide, water dikinase SelD n=1 Tax=Accumulibacter sp. TaxID=2053492 RepID=UPI0025D3D722|nr:selenide, water dikinase SelD [Accumulibacter sp.]MCM8595058.1 selenide, water dikinase SelD [Accumulibacter sp.]MDS4049204.1 selenide, water dikinase SelD [Accumulibacter sp.]